MPIAFIAIVLDKTGSNYYLVAFSRTTKSLIWLCHRKLRSPWKSFHWLKPENINNTNNKWSLPFLGDRKKISVSFSYCWDSTHCCMIFFFVWLCYLFFCVMISLDTFPIKPFIEEFGVFWIVFPLFFSNLAIGNRTDKIWQNADIFSSA